MKISRFKQGFVGAIALSVVALAPTLARAQTTYTENFTGTVTNNSWYFVNGACLTAGGTYVTTSPGQFPACTSASGTPISYYTAKGDSKLYGGNTGLLPDSSTLGGALRFTNGYPGGGSQNGAILSAFNFPTANGIQVSFTTETYRGNSYNGPAPGGVADGADGMSFFLQSVDSGQLADIGAYGGSLGFTCSNTNNDSTDYKVGPYAGLPRGYDGMIGGYIGLGIDEYGNFLNPGDNTASGTGFQGNRIGMRGAGSTAWGYLTATYPMQYPPNLTTSQRASAVQQACQNAKASDWTAVGLWDNFPIGPQPGVSVYKNFAGATVPLGDYAAIPNAYKLLGTTVKIANEAALYRGSGVGAQVGANYGVPITYNLTITPAGLLSLAYSYNGGVFQPVITGQDITAANGALPNNVRFGFAGSTGGGTNVHEIMCFQAQPATQTSVSAGINQKQSAKVQIGSQVYFAYYNPNNWPGSLTSQYLIPDPSLPGTLIINPTANWDASCVLTGVPAGQQCTASGVPGLTAAQGSSARTMLTYNGSQGIPFEWTNLTTAQQAALDTGDGSSTPLRLNYLRGDRSNELNAYGAGLYRARTSVLGDIVDSSPTWIGPASGTYSAVWHDAYPNGGMTAAPAPPENSVGAQSYPSFLTAEQTRTNVVYSGANDGFLHGFRSGAFDATNTYVSTDNDGQEVVAYMPAYILNAINSYTNVSNDYSNPQYAHHFDVDGTPGTGDLFYGNAWHTWLVGGLGAGGSAIYALDVTSPGVAGANNFSEGGASSTVVGEWSTLNSTNATTGVISMVSTTFTCANSSGCGANLGNTYGTPQIRRFHNGSWGFIIGNGIGSSTGDAGIYIAIQSSASSTPSLTWYYLSAGQSGTSDGIAFPAAVDLDHDNITDYVYAGDLTGHVWRFDLTDSNPANWGSTAPFALFQTSGSQPITTKPLIVINNTGPIPRLMIEFGTGQQKPVTNTSAATYATTQQALYGIWDWNMSVWNAKSVQRYTSMPTTAPGAQYSSLQVQTITGNFDATLTTTGSSYRTVSSTPVCYADTTGCSQYGWYLKLSIGPADPTNSGSPVVAEQVLFGPALLSGVFVVNTTIPPTSTPTTCAATPTAAWTIALDPLTGGALTDGFFQYYTGVVINVTTTTSGITSEQGVSSVANLGTGTPTDVVYQNQIYMVSSPANGAPPSSTLDPTKSITPVSTVLPRVQHPNVIAQRLLWLQRR